MTSIQLTMGPLQARLIVKALASTGRSSEFIGMYVSNDELNSPQLGIRSWDDSGTCICEYSFGSSYFDSFNLLGSVREHGPAVTLFSARLLPRLFKNAQSSNIIQIKMNLSNECLEFNFMWRNGLISRRMLRSVVPPSELALPYSVPPGTTSTGQVLSFSPKYLQNLLQLFPDSTALWALTITRKPGSNNSLILTNATNGIDTGSTVELTVSQSDLNRNGSYFSRSACTLTANFLF